MTGANRALAKRIGRLLVQWRQRHPRRNQTELAELLGVTQKSVSDWERGESVPEHWRIPHLARLLGVTIDELYGYPRR